MEKKRTANDIAQTGPLEKSQHQVSQKKGCAHFNQKIHRHVVLSAIAPPSKGPQRLAIAKTEPITPE